MRYRSLGDSGVQVSTTALGTMMFGAWGNPDADACRRMVDMAIDAGINLFDTADIYDDGRSEEILGEALAGRRDDVVLATKFGNPMGDDPNRRGGSRRWITCAVEDSLRRLRTDWIDLYQMHRPDPSTDIDDTLAALDDLVHAGKVRMIGTSTFPASELVEAQWAAARLGCTRPRSEQPPYSILARGVERDVLPACRRHGVGVVVWAPLNGGWLTGKYDKGGGAPTGSRAHREPDHFDHASAYRDTKLELVDRLSKVAADAGLRLVDLALAFVREHPAVTSAIVGPRTPEQLADLLAAADAPSLDGPVLDGAVLDAIDQIVRPGETVNPVDDGYVPPSLDTSARRR